MYVLHRFTKVICIHWWQIYQRQHVYPNSGLIFYTNIKYITLYFPNSFSFALLFLQIFNITLSNNQLNVQNDNAQLAADDFKGK